jgi:hypothetical protein
MGIHMESSVRHLSSLNTNSHVREENSGSTKKIVENKLLFLFITNQILALHRWSMDGLEKSL